MDIREFTGKTVDDAITSALLTLETTSDKIDYEVVEKGSSGILGLGSRPAKIKVTIKSNPEDIAKDFLSKVFESMNMIVVIKVEMNDNDMNINLAGDDMGVLIGKRGQTLDSLQYLLSLVVNKESVKYIRVKIDTENYRERRKETLENLAKNIAFKVKRSKRPVALEPMNPYERRIIHAYLQNDRYITTKSEGDEPFRHVVVLMKK